MTEMITVIWKGNSREIPGYGVGHDGQPITLPMELAMKFVKQSQAMRQQTKAKTKLKAEEKESE